MTISASTPKRVVVLLASISVALVLLLAGAVAARAADQPLTPAVTPQVHHTVVAGDTLWDVAALYADPGDDVRDMIQDIKDVNGLSDSVIEVGEVLLIPLTF